MPKDAEPAASGCGAPDQSLCPVLPTCERAATSGCGYRFPGSARCLALRRLLQRGGTGSAWGIRTQGIAAQQTEAVIGLKGPRPPSVIVTPNPGLRCSCALWTAPCVYGRVRSSCGKTPQKWTRTAFSKQGSPLSGGPSRKWCRRGCSGRALPEGKPSVLVAVASPQIIDYLQLLTKGNTVPINPDDYDDPELLAGWFEDQRNHVLEYLEAEGVSFDDIEECVPGIRISAWRLM